MNPRYQTADEELEAVWSTVEFSGADVRPTVASVGIFGSQPLKTTVTWNDLAPVELLLDADADIDARHEDGGTALHHAIKMGHFSMARLLLARGADQSIRNNAGKLARDCCSSLNGMAWRCATDV
jgi:ankyrin repeat protein